MSDPITPTVPAASEPALPAVVPQEDAVPMVETPQTDETRLKGALDKVEQKNEEMRKVVDLQASLVQENPALIHKIAKEVPEIADRIAEKLWSSDGVKSYKQLMERVELEQVKEKNPEAYKAQVDVSEIKRKLEAREEKDRLQTLSNFCAAKGIQVNPYDPNYSKLQESLNYVNPSLLEENYSKALELAFNMASSGAVLGGAPMPQTMNYSGSAASVLPTQKPPVSERSQWLASELNKQFKRKIDLSKA